MKKEMLINAVQPEECRIAILENGALEELYVERTSAESYVGNIYKGRIVNIEPSIQAAFVDFGVGRNGFLHVSDVEPAYYRHLLKDEEENSGRRRGKGGRRRSSGVSRPGAFIPPGKGSKKPEEEQDLTPEEMDEVMEEMEELAETVEHGEEVMVDELEELVEEMDLDVENLDTSTGTLFSPGSFLPPGLGDPAQISVIGEHPTNDFSSEEDESAPSKDEDQVCDEGNAESWGDENDDTTDSSTGEVEVAVEEKGKARKRGRGRSRKSSRGESARAASEQKYTNEEKVLGSTDEPAAGHTETTEDDTHKEPATVEQPLPMDSTERRTREEFAATSEQEEFDADEVALPEIGQGESKFADEELSFSMRPREPQENEEASEEESYENEEVVTEEEPVEESSEEPVAFEEKMPRRRKPMHNLEDDDVGYMPRRSSRGGRGRRSNNPRRGGRGMPRPKPLIQDIFKKGQEVLVQVIKEGIGTKGPTLSTYISIAGRYLVLMPGLNRIGVSRKITDEEKRRKLRDILSDLKPPKGLGFIIRTAGFDRTKKELQRDLAYLSRLWQVVVRRIRKLKAPAEIYQESDMITRTIRDTFTNDIQSIWVDDPRSYEQAKEFLQIVMPRHANRIKLYQGSEPMFHKYGIEQEINRIHEKHVPLPDGGSIVIEQTEALVAIDVNSGSFRAEKHDAEETAFQMNMKAAREIARQLRLRDMGGVIVNDFIDMRDEKHRRAVERALRDAVRRDRARTKILRMSSFGIIEMTRQRIRPSLKRSVFTDCKHCNGSGLVKTTESMSIDVMRMLQLAAARPNITEIVVKVPEEVCHYILNRRRQELVRLEEETGTKIEISGVFCAVPEFLEFVCYDNNGNELRFPPRDEPRKRYEGRR